MTALLRRHRAQDQVAFGPQGSRTAADLLRDAGTIAAGLPSPTDDSHLLLVFRHDRYAFAAALLGSWAAGHAVALPPNQQGATVTALLERPEVVALVHDTEAGGHLQVDTLLAGPSKPLMAPLVPSAHRLATVFTSGTTGGSMAWSKNASQLLGEVEQLARTFALPTGTRTLATVPPSHLYGLLFSVLLPLVTGGAFARDTPLHPEAVAERIAATQSSILVSVPVHLRSLQTLQGGTLRGLERVFSSTAPLLSDTAEHFHHQHELTILEIFGSTETGGIAWREQVHSDAWTPIEGVEVQALADGRLQVHSPFSSLSDHITADLVDLRDDGRFIHRGRVDGVVKVGGLRISLPAMEDVLLSMPEIDDAVVIAAPANARGVRLLAAVTGEEANEAAIRSALLARFEPSTVPRRILKVDRLPREANGKLLRRRVLQLFGLAEDGRPMPRQFEIGSVVHEALDGTTSVRVEVDVPKQLLWFQGHFDGYPVLAGVVQIHELLLPLIEQHGPRLGALQQLKRIKFLGRIVPGDALMVRLEFPAGQSVCDFSIVRRGGDTASCSAGRLVFRPSLSLVER